MSRIQIAVDKFAEVGPKGVVVEPGLVALIQFLADAQFGLDKLQAFGDFSAQVFRFQYFDSFIFHLFGGYVVELNQRLGQ